MLAAGYSGLHQAKELPSWNSLPLVSLLPQFECVWNLIKGHVASLLAVSNDFRVNVFMWLKVMVNFEC